MRPTVIVNNSSKDHHKCRVYNNQFSVDYAQINCSFDTLLNYNKQADVAGKGENKFRSGTATITTLHVVHAKPQAANSYPAFYRENGLKR